MTEPPATCADCGRTRTGRFCEHCGHDERTPPPTARWELEITVDGDQFRRVAPPGLAHPDERSPVRVALADEEVRVGRDRAGQGLAVNDDGPLVDPGVSRHHCTFERLHDGGYGVRDAGSGNGTTINDDRSPVAPFALVPLADGDRVHVGAWTALHYRGVHDGD